MAACKNLLREKAPIDKSFVHAGPRKKGRIIVDFDEDPILQIEFQDFMNNLPKPAKTKHHTPSELCRKICGYYDFRGISKKKPQAGDHLLGDLILQYKGLTNKHLNLFYALVMEKAIENVMEPDKLEVKVNLEMGLLLCPASSNDSANSHIKGLPHYWIGLIEKDISWLIDPVNKIFIGDVARMEKKAHQWASAGVLKEWEQKSSMFLPYESVVEQLSGYEERICFASKPKNSCQSPYSILRKYVRECRSMMDLPRYASK